MTAAIKVRLATATLAVLFLLVNWSSVSFAASSIWAQKDSDTSPSNYTSSGLQSALNYCSPNGVVYVGPGTIEVSSTISVPSGVTLQGAGMGVTTIKLANNGGVDILTISSRTDVSVRDLTLDGNKANNSVEKSGLYCTSSTRVRVDRVHAKDTEKDGFYFSGCTDVAVVSCISENNERNGFSCGDAAGRSVRVRFIGCTSSGHAGGSDIGFALEPASYSSVVGCVSNGDYRGVTCLGGSTDSADYNEIANNSIIDFGYSGITLGPGTAGSAHVIVSGNTLRPANTLDVTEGITFNSATDVTIVGNRIASFNSEGSSSAIAGLNSPTRFVVANNFVGSAGNYGIIVGGGTRGTVSGNIVRNASADSTGIRDGIRLSDCTDVAVVGNNVYDDQGTPTTNFALQTSGTSDRTAIDGNVFRGAAQANQIAMVGSANWVGDNQGLPTPSVASASTVTLPAWADRVKITGTTAITSVTAGVAGRQVTLIFSGALTFTDGSNLKLAGNFSTGADDTITLASDGTNWFEISRANN